MVSCDITVNNFVSNFQHCSFFPDHKNLTRLDLIKIDQDLILKILSHTILNHVNIDPVLFTLILKCNSHVFNTRMFN